MEALPDFRLDRPATLERALASLADEPAARAVAGGTDLLVNMRRGLVETPVLVDLSGVAELQGIEADTDGLRIGAAVTLDALARHPVVLRAYAAIAQAAGAVAGPTHRNYGTVGGNLCLDTRCLYYNQSQWWRESNDYCLKYRGSVCHVAPKSKLCFATFSGDLAPALLVHEAEVAIAGPGGRRRIALAALYTGDGIDYLSLAPGEVVTEVRVPAGRAGTPQAYAKARVRGSIDFPLAGLALLLRREGEVVAELRAALTASDMRPFLVPGTDEFHGWPLDEAAIVALGERVRQAARPMGTTTLNPWYRRRVVAGLARKLARTLWAG